MRVIKQVKTVAVSGKIYLQLADGRSDRYLNAKGGESVMEHAHYFYSTSEALDFCRSKGWIVQE